MPSTSECTALGLATALGDDALIAAQRLIEWVARAPQIEEDVALANIALDLLGQARSFYTRAGELSEPTLSEDDLAYGREPADFRNAVLLERANGDFAVTMVRLLLLAAYQGELYAELRRDVDPVVAAIAAKAVPEVRYHRDHARLWVLRLGDGTEESHDRAQAAVEAEWPWFDGLFQAPTGSPAIAEQARGWASEVLAEATLAVPDAAPLPLDGRRGEHTGALDALLAELQQVARQHPGARW